MKNLVFVIVITMMFGMFSQPTFAQKKGNKVVCFESNMDCADCEKTISEHLKFEKGVKDLKVDHSSNTILVEYKEGKNTEEGLAKAVEKKGYKADKITPDQYKKIIENAAQQNHEHEAEVHKERK